jgi:hypothetical protein
MTALQEQVLTLAQRLGADPAEVEAAVRLMKSGRCDLLVEVCAARMSIKAALRIARSMAERR